MTVEHVKDMLAEWRRRGEGVWYVTLVIDGHDDVFTLLYPGTMDKDYVRLLAQQECGAEHDTMACHVHVTEMERRDRE